MEISVNGKTYKVRDGKLNGKPIEWDLADLGDGSFHIIRDGRSYSAEVLSVDERHKELLIRVAGQRYNLSIKDRYDELLEQLGMTSLAGNKVADLKAPMPGLVIDVLIKKGDQVTKGMPLIVLEAMKMENILKSHGEGVVMDIAVEKGTAVEKNQLLVLID